MAAVMTQDKEVHTTVSREPDRGTAAYTLIAGIGASGLAAARYLSALGESLLLIDSRNEPPSLADLERDCPQADIELATLDPKWLIGAKQLVLSPGLSIDSPLVAEARNRGIEVVGELELFARATTRPVLAVTGSNGKSTVTSLAAYLLRAQGLNALAGGNLGPPALQLLEHDSVDVFVLEVSSFQLETTRSLKPVAAALLNISPDHIDRHGSLARYAALKMSLLTAAQYAIVNLDDPMLKDIGQITRATIGFSVHRELVQGWSAIKRSGQRWLAHDAEPLLASVDLKLFGATGEANALAALALVDCYGGDIATAVAAMPGFHGLPHRMSHVLDRSGVSFIDDSKGTNVGATVAAISGLTQPIVLIAGGQSKGADFAPLVAAARERVRAAVLLGEAAEELDRMLGADVRCVRAESMHDAVTIAAQLAEAGDCVLLSPACASQDMFSDYRERGTVFANAVRGLPQ